MTDRLKPLTEEEKKALSVFILCVATNRGAAIQLDIAEPTFIGLKQRMIRKFAKRFRLIW